MREVQEVLQEHGATASQSGLSRFFRRHGITLKKGRFTASEQSRPDVIEAREAWFDGQLDLDPERVVFIDETAAATNMERRYGRAELGRAHAERSSVGCSAEGPRGERCRIAVPHGHYKTNTVTAALRASGPFTISLSAQEQGLAAQAA